MLLCSPCLFTALCVGPGLAGVEHCCPRTKSTCLSCGAPLGPPHNGHCHPEYSPGTKQLEGGVRGGLVISRSPEPSFHLQACASPTLLSKEKEGRVRTKCGRILSLAGKKQDSFIFTSKRETIPLSSQPFVCRPSTRNASCCYLPFSLAGKDR